MTQFPEGTEGGGMSSVPMAGRLEMTQKEMGGTLRIHKELGMVLTSLHYEITWGLFAFK